MGKNEIQERERVGAYVIDKDGNTVPDLNDEAMAARVKPVVSDAEPSEIRPPVQSGTKSKKGKEVKQDA